MQEVKSVVVAVLKITVFFTLFLYLPHFSQGINIALISTLALKVFIGVGLGTFVHELFHKLVALPYDPGAKITGSAVQHKRLPLRQSGIISLAGPIGSILTSLSFLALAQVTQGFFLEIVSFGFFINAILGAYNLIPLHPFDGKSIYAWSKIIWFLAFATSMLLAYYAYTGPIGAF
jgi:hypothetical protein